MKGDAAPALEAYESYAEIYDDFNFRNDYEMWIGAVLLPRLLGCGLTAPGQALDIACGIGRAFPPLLSRGWGISGCDVSPAMVSIARERFGDRVRIDVADMRYLPTFGSFDLVLVLNDSMNHLLDEQALDQTMAGIARNLSPSGLLVFDCGTRALFSKAFAIYERRAVERHGRRWIWQGLGKSDAPGPTYRAQISGDSIEPITITERHFSHQEVSSAFGVAGLECRAALGQHEADGRVVLTEEPNAAKDDKIVYIASHQKS